MSKTECINHIPNIPPSVFQSESRYFFLRLYKKRKQFLIYNISCPYLAILKFCKFYRTNLKSWIYPTYSKYLSRLRSWLHIGNKKQWIFKFVFIVSGFGRVNFPRWFVPERIGIPWCQYYCITIQRLRDALQGGRIYIPYKI